MSLELTEDFLSIVLENRPLLDVRAEVEFNKGSFPNATNIAILDDEQRRLVGICYKEKGNEKAVELGRELVTEEVQALRLHDWKAFIEANPEAYIYCFRGGQRSRISQMWLDEVGVKIPRLKGGYKAFRAFLTEQAEEITSNLNTIIVGGRTGSGKSILLQELSNMIDLEGLANHRGSSFGRFISAQPAQINFEDALYYKLIQHHATSHKSLVIEHESKRIGDLTIPKPIFDNFMKGGLVILETPMSERLEITYAEYVTLAIQDSIKQFGDDGRAEWFLRVDAGLDRIRKRLGSEHHIKIKALFKEAYEENNDEGHKIWIEILLEKYYDPMYDYQIEKTSLPILFRGNKKEVLKFIASY